MTFPNVFLIRVDLYDGASHSGARSDGKAANTTAYDQEIREAIGHTGEGCYRLDQENGECIYLPVRDIKSIAIVASSQGAVQRRTSGWNTPR